MSSVKDMDDNTSYMQEFQPLDSREREAVEKVVEIFKAENVIPNLVN